MNFNARYLGEERIAYPMAQGTVYPITIKHHGGMVPISVTVELPEGAYHTKFFQIYYSDEDALFSDWETQIE